MKRALVLIVSITLAPSVAFADAPHDAAPRETFAQPNYVRTLVGFGGVPDVPSANMVLTMEVGHRPFLGALATGASFSSVSDLTGAYTVETLGVFAKLDLTYVICSHFWARHPSPSLPVRVQLGSRIGLGVSDSFGLTPSYVLVRAEMQPFVDIEVPLDVHHTYSFVVRGALDTSVNFNALFRWSASIGFTYGWGHV